MSQIQCDVPLSKMLPEWGQYDRKSKCSLSIEVANIGPLVGVSPTRTTLQLVGPRASVKEWFNRWRLLTAFRIMLPPERLRSDGIQRFQKELPATTPSQEQWPAARAAPAAADDQKDV